MRKTHIFRRIRAFHTGSSYEESYCGQFKRDASMRFVPLAKATCKRCLMISRIEVPWYKRPRKSAKKLANMQAPVYSMDIFPTPAIKLAGTKEVAIEKQFPLPPGVIR